MVSMKAFRSWNIMASVMLLLGGLASGLPSHTATADESPPDYWYIETVTLDAAGLPSDFHVFSGNASPEQVGEGVWLTTSNPAKSPRAAIYLINHSPQPIYVMSLEYRDRLVMSTPDQSYDARVRWHMRQPLI